MVFEMENVDKTPATPEKVWEILMENARQMEKTRAEWNEKYEKSRTEWNENYEKSRAEWNENFEKSRAEWNEKREKSNADYERRMKIMDERYEFSRADYERRMKNMEDRYGSQSFNLGSFAEEYFFNSFEDGKQNFFGEQFDDIERNVKGPKRKIKDEYDIVLFNCTSVAIIETKFKAHVNDLPSVVKKAETFRINYPEFANHRIFLGLASMSFYPELEKKCADEGIAVIKQVGDKVVIIDERLKEF